MTLIQNKSLQVGDFRKDTPDCGPASGEQPVLPDFGDDGGVVRGGEPVLLFPVLPIDLNFPDPIDSIMPSSMLTDRIFLNIVKTMKSNT